VPADLPCKTKPTLGGEMIQAVHRAHTWRARWVTWDEAFGRATTLLDHIDGLGLWYFAEGPQDTQVGRQRPATAVPPGEELAVATTHADSVVFASAFAIVLASLWEGEVPGWSPRSWFALLVLAAGMVANNRRLVWVEVIGIVVTYVLISRRTRFERNLIRGLVLSLPLLVPYCLIGWNSDAAAFKPVKIIRSVTDSDSDGSTKWRDFENWNLVFTVADHPVLGSGFGHEYAERWKLPDISSMYRQYRFMPHNSVLGLWASVGVVGFCLIWTLVVAGVFLAARSYRFATKPAHKALALGALGITVAYVNQCYGDIGANAWAGVFVLVPALVSVGKLAVVTGAWPARRRRTIAVPFAKAAPEMASANPPMAATRTPACRAARGLSPVSFSRNPYRVLASTIHTMTAAPAAMNSPTLSWRSGYCPNVGSCAHEGT